MTDHEYDRSDDGRQNDDRSTSDAFADHGIAEGSTLIADARARLRDAGHGEFDPSAAFYRDLADAFRLAFLAAAGAYRVPERVDAAVEDARHATRIAFEDDPEADLRAAVLPEFYRQAAGFYRAYRDHEAARASAGWRGRDD